MNILEKLYIVVGIVIGIGLILGAIALIYYLIKKVYLDIKEAEDWNERYRNLYKEKYEADVKKAKDDYERSLRLKSEEYFRKFYEEDKKKKAEENQNGNQV